MNSSKEQPNMIRYALPKDVKEAIIACFYKNQQDVDYDTLMGYLHALRFTKFCKLLFKQFISECDLFKKTKNLADPDSTANYINYLESQFNKLRVDIYGFVFKKDLSQTSQIKDNHNLPNKSTPNVSVKRVVFGNLSKEQAEYTASKIVVNLAKQNLKHLLKIYNKRGVQECRKQFQSTVENTNSLGIPVSSEDINKVIFHATNINLIAQLLKDFKLTHEKFVKVLNSVSKPITSLYSEDVAEAVVRYVKVYPNIDEERKLDDQRFKKQKQARDKSGDRMKREEKNWSDRDRQTRQKRTVAENKYNKAKKQYVDIDQGKEAEYYKQLIPDRQGKKSSLGV